jgi:dTDP-4-dehydrorhamnose reductase
MSAGARDLELWGGVECTVNRVGDRYHDQLDRSGHAGRAEDLERFAALGIQALRYPVLWERTAPDGLDRADWSWADARLHRLRELGVRPIVGLVHHGSGPRTTSLIDPGFAGGLARFARAVAERHPWIEDYTPVNEPLTTARFSGLYGHWYPHGRGEACFVRALLVQCRAVALAMRAVREVCPRARLVQTEDFGETFSTPLLAYQAEYENLRRLLSIDLLTGRVDRDHPLFADLLAAGATRAELAAFVEEPCPPDVLGVNYYVTSDRFLDERTAAYPAWSRGGNGRHAYADIEAARAAGQPRSGHRALLVRLSRRYGLPLAVTEAHLGGTREEQLRWLAEAWRGALEARAEGAEVRAVTAWSLLGAFDWHNLVTREQGVYEAGVFDVRSPAPRPTALAAMAGALARGEPFDHPVLSSPGWWRRPEAAVFGPPPPEGRRAAIELVEPAQAAPLARPLLITGAAGTLGTALARICAARGLPCRRLRRGELDIADPGSIARALDALDPWAIINAAGYVRVDDAERDRARCERENTRGPEELALACRERGVRLLSFSSDLVFDGGKGAPYDEGDPVAPLSVYGRTKADAERRVLALLPSALLVRTGAFFGPWDEHNFVTITLRALSEGRVFRAASDLTVSPTYVPDLADAVLDLLIDGESGIWHVANQGAVTWADLAARSASLAGVDARRLVPSPGSALGLTAPRPPYSALGSGRGLLLPLLEDALSRYVAARGAGRAWSLGAAA